jgi:hypothetical protein
MAMRVLAIVAAAGFAVLVPTLASAAELEVPQDRCARGQAWNGSRCEWIRPRVSEAPRVYEAPPAYVEREVEVYEEPVYVARPYYVAPPVYVGPIYRPPVFAYYAGPRYGYGWGHGGSWGHGGGRHFAWRR